MQGEERPVVAVWVAQVLFAFYGSDTDALRSAGFELAELQRSMTERYGWAMSKLDDVVRACEGQPELAARIFAADAGQALDRFISEEGSR